MSRLLALLLGAIAAVLVFARAARADAALPDPIPSDDGPIALIIVAIVVVIAVIALVIIRRRKR